MIFSNRRKICNYNQLRKRCAGRLKGWRSTAAAREREDDDVVHTQLVCDEVREGNQQAVVSIFAVTLPPAAAVLVGFGGHTLTGGASC